MHFLMSFIHKYVSPVSENKTLFLFLRTQISKNGGTTELIQICVRYDIISLLSETMPDCFGHNMVFVYISIANTQS